MSTIDRAAMFQVYEVISNVLPNRRFGSPGSPCVALRRKECDPVSPATGRFDPTVAGPEVRFWESLPPPSLHTRRGQHQ